MLQAFAIVKTLSFLTLEGDSKAEQTLNKHTCVGKQNHLKAVLKKKKKKKAFGCVVNGKNWLLLFLKKQSSILPSFSN